MNSKGKDCEAPLPQFLEKSTKKESQIGFFKLQNSEVNGSYTKGESSSLYKSATESQNQNDFKKIKLSYEKTLEDFITLEKLGKGSFGEVHKADDKRRNQFLALKIVNDQLKIKNEVYILENIEQIRKSLKEEEKKLFLKYFGVYEDPSSKDSFTMIMQNGLLTLKDFIVAGRKFSCEEILAALLQIAYILMILEKNGIVHSDIKPENVIVNTEKLKEENSSSLNLFFAIADFGESFYVSNPNKLTHMSERIGGSPYYAAPEIPKSKNINDKEYDPFKADVYSLGMSILEMLGAKKKSNKIVDLFKPISSEKMSNLLFYFVTKMMEETPCNRISFEEIYEKLKNFQLHLFNENIEFIHKAIEIKQIKRLEEKYKKKEQYQDLLNKEIFKENMFIFKCYFNDITRIYESKYYIEKCHDIFKNNLRLFDKNEKRELIENLALQYEKIGDYEKAEKFRLEFIDICKQIHEEAKEYNNVGFLYEKKQEFEKAENAHLNSTEICEILKKRKKKQINEKHKSDQKIKRLKQTKLIQIDEEKVNEKEIKSYIILGDTHKQNGNLKSAVKYYEKLGIS